MAKKVLLRDWNNDEVLPITRGELVLDSSGKEAFRSTEFLATTSQPGLMSAMDKFKIDNIENSGGNGKVSQVTTTTNDVYRLLFSETADDETRIEGTQKSAKLLFNPSTGVLQASGLIGNLDGTYINKLTGYSKATLISDITSEDTLTSALGKVELRAEVAYNLIQGAYDGDGTIENLAEILKVLEGISDTETIQAIVGKYLPLTGGTISNNDNFKLILNDEKDDNYNLIKFTQKGTTKGYIGTKRDAFYINFSSYEDMYYNNNIIIHSGNIGNYNVGSADKLNDNTEYTAWGQTFFKNGVPQDVSGDIRNVGALYLTRTSDNANAFYISNISGTDIFNFATTGGSSSLTFSTTTSGYPTEKMRITHAGNVLIGTTTDTGTKLYVNGDVRFDGQTKISGSMRFYGKTSLSSDMYIDNQSVGGLNFAWSDGVSRFFIGDKVGIGTTNPQSKLEVNGDISSTNLWPIHVISKSLTITSDWTDTGISFNSTNFPHGNGSYILQMDRENTYFYTGYLSVVLNDGAVSVDDVDEIILHGGGFDSASQYYLRTKQDASSKTTKIQIATSGPTHTRTINFKFKRII